MQERQRPKLGARLAQKELLVAPGVFDGISAKIADQMDFEVLYMTGYGAVASHLGLPDAGIATYTDMVSRVAVIAGGSQTPLIADGDTGYGGLLNVQYTVRGYEAAGAVAFGAFRFQQDAVGGGARGNLEAFQQLGGVFLVAVGFQVHAIGQRVGAGVARVDRDVAEIGFYFDVIAIVDGDGSVDEGDRQHLRVRVPRRQLQHREHAERRTCRRARRRAGQRRIYFARPLKPCATIGIL